MPSRKRPLSRATWLLTERMVTVPPTGDLPPVTAVDLPGRGQTAVFDTGPRDAPPVMLLHGLGCTALLNWYAAVPELAKRYRVIGLDLRWHGGGIRCPEFSLEDCADDAAALADALGLGTFTAAGYSMGGLVGQLLARRHEDRLRGLVLCATAPTFRQHAREVAVLDAFGRTATLWQARALRLLPGQGPRDGLRDHRWLYSQLRTTRPSEVLAAVDVIGRFDSTAWLPTLRVPTAVVVTARDRAVPPVRQRRLARAIPEATMFDINAGHTACVLRADAFVPGVVAACASVHARG